MIHLYSGEGRGKTSIAVGTAVRMAGAGGRIIFAQFMKGSVSSEVKVLKSLPGLEICRVPEEYPFYNQMSKEQIESITKQHNDILTHIMEEVESVRSLEENEQDVKEAKGQMQSDIPRLLVVLDEITYPVSWNLIDKEMVSRLLSNLPESVELIMTGRSPSKEMITFSDYWSELSMKRHPYEKGVAAREGVEY